MMEILILNHKIKQESNVHTYDFRKLNLNSKPFEPAKNWSSKETIIVFNIYIYKFI